MAPTMKARDVAELCGVHADTIRRWSLEGHVPHYQLGPNVLRYDAEEIQAWLQQHHVPAIVARSRAEQGLPPHVDDPAALGRAVVALADRPKTGDGT